MFVRVMQDKWTPEGGAGPGPLREEASEREAPSGSGEQHPAERSGQSSASWLEFLSSWICVQEFKL